MDNNEHWTEVISPKAHLLDIRLKEIWHYRDLLFLFVKRDMVSQYRQTILGQLWHVIQPVFTTIMFLIVFNKIAKIPTDALPPVLFYMSSITIWNYFSGCLVNTSATFTTNAGIFGKVYFPRLILPLSIVVSNMARFGIQLGLLIVLIIYYYLSGQYRFHFGVYNLLIPVIAIVMALLGFSLGIIISSLTTKYRDLAVLVSFGVQLLMYVTPVAYPLSYLSQSKYKALIQANPLSPLVEAFRYTLFGTGTFSVSSLLYSIAFTFFAMVIGVIIFNKVERSFMDTV